jgi:uncharacterized membrane protein
LLQQYLKVCLYSKDLQLNMDFSEKNKKKLKVIKTITAMAISTLLATLILSEVLSAALPSALAVGNGGSTGKGGSGGGVGGGGTPPPSMCP